MDHVSAPPAALDGIRVVELGSLIAGPFCGRLLADFGADVVKIEAPGAPDPLRDWGQAELDGRHVFWTVHARNKRCITLDLRADRGRELFLDLVATADVVVESFRPGTLERWDLGFERLRERRPDLVLARVSGYGQTGPDARLPGYASVAEGVSGLRHLNGFPGGPPPRMALSLGDSLAGMFAVQGVLTALLARDRGHGGQVVDASLTESCLAVTESVIPDYDLTGHVRGPSGTRLEGLAPSNVYRCADDQWLIVAANQDTVFRRLCEVMGRPELADDERFATHVARGRNQDEIDEIVGAWTATLPADEVEERLREAGVVVGPINDVSQVVEVDQFLARDMVVPHHDLGLGRDVLGPGVVPLLHGTPGAIRWAGPPAPGAHNAEVYGELGLDRAELEALAAARVI